MTAQEIFTTVKTHLLKQNAKAKGYNTKCVYRTHDGKLMCAVGCLIPDRLYSVDIEGNNVTELVDNCPAFWDLFGEHLSLLDDLQHIHDNEEVQVWRESLQDLAIKRNLKY